MQKMLLLLVVLVAFAGTGSYVLLNNAKAGAPGNLFSNSNTHDVKPTVTDAQNTGPTPPQYDIDSASSTTIIVNKQRPLPADYKADDLYAPDVPLRQSGDAENMQVRRVMETDLNAMVGAAKEAGSQLIVGSAFRSAATQRSLYDGYVASSGQEYADLTSARPGFSEHQTGLAIDFINAAGSCFLEKCFADTEEGKWLAANAHRYGFVLRYPLDKTPITGYDFEPWHYRYIGIETAEKVFAKGVTLEEFFGLDPAPTYKP